MVENFIKTVGKCLWNVGNSRKRVNLPASAMPIPKVEHLE